MSAMLWFVVGAFLGLFVVAVSLALGVWFSIWRYDRRLRGK